MDQVFIYNKSYQDRLHEFINILGCSKLHSIADVKKEWSLYLELTMDPNGWQAIWKIPRLVCEELEIEYPAQALVYVDIIDFQELNASICILLAQSDIVLPNKTVVPLIQLSITKEQDNSIGLNLDSTANCLDMLTFFYTHIVMPWDYDDEDTNDWLEKHLEQRLRLYYDMSHNAFSKLKIERLQSLLNKARRLQAYRTCFESKVEESEDDVEVEKLLNIHVSLALIHTEVEILANPLFRNVNFEYFQELQGQKSISTHIHWIVFESGNTIDDQIVMLKMVESIIEPESIIHPVTTIIEPLQSVSLGDYIWLNKGVYEISKTAFLPDGVVMKSLYSQNETTLTATNDDILFNCSGTLVLENLTLDVKIAQWGILIKSGCMTLKNCKIVGDGKTSTHRGIMVLGGSKLHMINCHISHCYTAIMGYSLSSIKMENCKITDVVQGLKLFDQCNVDAENVLFSNCKNYAVVVETNEQLSEDVLQQRSFSVLEMFPEIKLHNVTGENNGKGDAVAIHKIKLKPITDLFSNPDLDPTIIHNESNDEMNISIN